MCEKDFTDLRFIQSPGHLVYYILGVLRYLETDGFETHYFVYVLSSTIIILTPFYILICVLVNDALGIAITDNMDWGQHILDISSKAIKTLGFKAFAGT